MKKNISVFFISFFIFPFLLFSDGFPNTAGISFERSGSGFELSQKIGDKVYKTVTINGQNFSKWLIFYSVSEYDSSGNEVFYESPEKSINYEYDKNNHLIHSKSANGFETWYDYDSKGNKVHSKDTNNKELWYKYDSKGNNVYVKSTAGSGYEIFYEYDDFGNIICKKTKDSETWYEYDQNRYMIHSNGTKENEIWNKYDTHGNIIYSKIKNRNTGKLTESHFSYEYDNMGNVIYNSGMFNNWWYEYEFSSDGKIAKKYTYKNF